MIAIVDDDDAVRAAAEQLIQSLGYNASTVASADEFLKSEKLHDTSCLITDLHMPGLSGLDLQDRLITSGHRIPIIFITGYPSGIKEWSPVRICPGTIFLRFAAKQRRYSITSSARRAGARPDHSISRRLTGVLSYRNCLLVGRSIWSPKLVR